MTFVARRLTRDWRMGLLAALTIALALAALLVPAMPQPLSYHEFADRRSFWSIPNFFNVASNLPFLIAGALGLHFILTRRGCFIRPDERLPYLVFFLGALLTCFGSAYYHASPDNARLVWDRMPMTLGFAGLVAAAAAERVDIELGLRSLWPLLALGIASVLYWQATERAGVGNVIPYAAYQAWSIALIGLLLLVYPARRYTQGRLLAWAALWYGLAKAFETLDLQVYRLLGESMSGHSIKHVLASLAVFAVLRQLRTREPAAVSDRIATA
jgi:hypothetical protein